MRLKTPSYGYALAEHRPVYRSLRSAWIFNQTPSDICSILVEKGPSCKNMQKCVATPQRTASLLKSCLEISLHLWLNKAQGWSLTVDYKFNSQNQEKQCRNWMKYLLKNFCQPNPGNIHYRFTPQGNNHCVLEITTEKEKM